MKPIDRNILRLALPSIVSNITVPLLGLCDVAVMGHVGGATHIGAIAVGSMIFNVMYWLFGFLRMSTSGLTAQAYGAGAMVETQRLLRHTLKMALAWGMAIIVLQLPLQWLTFWLMQADGIVAELCTPYFHIVVWGAPAVLGLYGLSGWLVGMQNTRIPMMIAIGQNVVNIALSLTLVVGFGMGIHGVAIGTLTAQWAGFLGGLLLSKGWLSKNRHLAVDTHPEATEKLRQEGPKHGTLNIDIFLRTLCLVSVNLYFTSAGSAQGPLILAANTLLMQFFMVYSYITDGFASAGEALSGRYTGAADRPMLSATVRHLFAWGLAVALLFTLVYLLAGPAILSLLTSDGEVVLTAMDYLPWAVLIPLSGMAAFVWDGIFIGTTRSRAMLTSCAAATACFFALWLLLRSQLHNHALWLALLVYLAVRGLVQTLDWTIHHGQQP